MGWKRDAQIDGQEDGWRGDQRCGKEDQLTCRVDGQTDRWTDRRLAAWTDRHGQTDRWQTSRVAD